MQGRFSGKKTDFSSKLEKSVFLPLGKSVRNEEKQRSGCPFFSPIFFGQAKTTLRVERCFSNGTKCQGAAAVKWGRPLGETKSINARRSRSKMKSPFRRNLNLPQKNKNRPLNETKAPTQDKATAKTSTKPLPKQKIYV